MLVGEFVCPRLQCTWLDRDFLVRRFAYREHARLENSVSEPFLRTWRPFGISMLCTSGAIKKHTDSEELPPYCWHAILLNDGYIAKGPDQKAKRLRQQVPGTVICLNIHEEHHLIRDARVRVIKDDYPTWGTLTFNTHERMDPHQVILELQRRVALIPEKLITDAREAMT